MEIFFSRFERIARYLMGIAATIGVLGLLVFKLEWIGTASSYKNDAWYLVRSSNGVLIASEYADQIACSRDESSSTACRSGKSLAEEMQRATSAR